MTRSIPICPNPEHTAQDKRAIASILAGLGNATQEACEGLTGVSTARILWAARELSSNGIIIRKHMDDEQVLLMPGRCFDLYWERIQGKEGVPQWEDFKSDRAIVLRSIRSKSFDAHISFTAPNELVVRQRNSVYWSEKTGWIASKRSQPDLLKAIAPYDKTQEEKAA